MRRIPFPRTLAFVAVLVAGLGIALATFDWNWLKGPLTRRLSTHLGRAVEIRGPLAGEFSLRPLVTADDVTIANADWGSDPVMARARRVALRVDLPSLARGVVSLPEVTLSDAAVLLERDADGRDNWTFGGAKPFDVGRFAVDAGTLKFRDAGRGIDIDANVASAASGDDGQLAIRFDSKGVWEKNDFVAHGTATTPFARDLKDRPYRLDVEARSGATKGSFAGKLVPAKGGEIDGALTLSGADLSALDAIVPFEFAKTPAYRLTANLKHADKAWSLAELSAKIGQTDLAGSLSIDRKGKRTLVRGDLTANATSYTDLRALIGFSGDPPRGRGAAGTVAKAPATVTAKSAGSSDLARLHLIDAKLALKAKRFTVGKWRFENASTNIDVDDGVLKMTPVAATLAGGKVGGALAIDARQKIASATVDLTARDVELSELFPVLKKRGSAGKASGRAHLTATGTTAAELLASTSGEVAMLSAGGTSGTLSSSLADIDLAQASKLLLRGEAASPIRCAATDLAVERGVMRVKTLVVDTDDETIVGRGAIDLPDQRYDLELESQSKTPSLLAYKGPVLVEGPFKHPNVHAKSGPLLARVGAAIGLAVINPAAALLPLVDIGGAAGVNCRALLSKTKGELQRLKEDAKGPDGARAVGEEGSPSSGGEAGSTGAPGAGGVGSAGQHPERARQPQR
jgi:uncharacterized protein involved in outer membrane biogenesis